MEDKKTKVCSKCGEEKELGEFGTDKCGKLGKKSYCKKCKNKYDEEYRSRPEIQEKLKIKEKERWERDKEDIKKKRDNDEYREYARQKTKEYRGRNKGIIKIVRDKKVCPRCKKEKKMEEFALDKSSIDGRTHQCKVCRRQNTARYRKTFEGQEKIREYDRKRSEVPWVKLRKNVSRTILWHLKKQKEKKIGSILQALPYTIQQLKEHLEKQWEPWMNWNNYGVYKTDGRKKWHIDHIYPQSRLRYNTMKHPNFAKCWALENLRPMEALENMKKKDTILFIMNKKGD